MIPGVDGHDVDAVDARDPRGEGERRPADPDLLQDRDRQGRAEQGRHPRGARRAARRRGGRGDARRRSAGRIRRSRFRADVYEAWDARARGAALERRWNEQFAAYENASIRTLAARVPAPHGGRAARGLGGARAARSSTKTGAKAETIATRKASQNAIEGLAPVLPELVGGSADLTGSNLTMWSGSKAGERERRRQLHLLRRARVRHVRDHERHRAARRLDPVRRHLPDVLRLRAQRAAHGGADEAAHDLRLHPRLDRPRRGRPDAPVGRARREPAPDPQHGRLAAVRHGRVGRRVGRGDRAPGRPDARFSSRARTCRSRAATPQAIASIRRGGYVLADARGTRARSSSPPARRCRSRSARSAKLAEEGVAVRVVSMPCTSVFDRQDAAYRDAVLPRGRAARRGRGGRHRLLAQVRRRG